MPERFKQVIVARFPELANASFTLLTAGWDSVGVDVNDRLIFKFPREKEGIEALRREADMLRLIRPRVTLPVPDLEFFEVPQPFSKHTKLKGEHLVTALYEELSHSVKQRLAGDIARFYTELHTIDPAIIQAAGAMPIEPWPAPDLILAGIRPHLAKTLLVKAEKTLDEWTRLADDPCGITFGFFDGHGWNMAFDYENQQLTGIYDFGDSGFGELHQEFIYTSFIAPDLTSRVIDEYNQLTGYQIDLERVTILTGVLFLTELAEVEENPEHASAILNNAMTWLAGR